MSEREDFLARWSRRKRQATDEVEDAPITAEPRASEQRMEGEKSLDNETLPKIEPMEQLFDPTTLPSIESISAETDIRAFLAPGVPAELTRAALRRAWAADPTIRDFVGLADYAWDFHAPGAMAGFGPLEMTDELRREILGMLTRGQSQDDAVGDSISAPSKKMAQSPQQFSLASELGGNESQEATDVNQPGELHVCSEVRPEAEGDAAAQYPAPEQQQSQVKVQRRHGRALPKS